MISLNKHFEADFLWKVSLEILNSVIILKTFTHAYGIRTKISKFAHINVHVWSISLAAVNVAGFILYGSNMIFYALTCAGLTGWY